MTADELLDSAMVAFLAPPPRNNPEPNLGKSESTTISTSTRTRTRVRRMFGAGDGGWNDHCNWK